MTVIYSLHCMLVFCTHCRRLALELLLFVFHVATLNKVYPIYTWCKRGHSLISSGDIFTHEAKRYHPISIEIIVKGYGWK